jgi:transcriptional regulator with XRE-family HTH domain
MTSAPVGALLKDWRSRRRVSQLDLAHRADVSPKHLSFVETGRSRPSPELLMSLAVHLDVLTQTAAKLCAVVESGRGLTAEGMAEYVYPAQRAREFLRQFSGQNGRESYKQFATLVDRYASMVREVDAARATERDWKQVLPQLAAERDALEQLAIAVRADLKREG